LTPVNTLDCQVLDSQTGGFTLGFDN
jgi:hypothetical protein